MSGFVVAIPARYESSRLPGKVLIDINGKPMLQHVYDRALESDADEVVVATDNPVIAEAVESFGGNVCMTGQQHPSGTDRIAEAADVLDWDDAQVVVNLQGDEPTMPATLINQCAGLLRDGAADIGTLASPFQSEGDFASPNCVKVIRDQDGRALYFSRAAIPFAREAGQVGFAMASALHHHGIYAYRCSVLRQLVCAEPARLEISERLEQLRALSLGMSILVGVARQRPGTGVDTDTDLARVRSEIRTPD